MISLLTRETLRLPVNRENPPAMTAVPLDIVPTMARILHTKTYGANTRFQGYIRYLDIRGRVHSLKFSDSGEFDRFLERAKKAYRRYLDTAASKATQTDF